MNENDNTANAVNGSGAFEVEGNPLDPCGEALYGSKACADFVNEAKNIHARQIAERFAAEQDVRNQPK